MTPASTSDFERALHSLSRGQDEELPAYMERVKQAAEAAVRETVRMPYREAGDDDPEEA
jgi:hypothetical protein